MATLTNSLPYSVGNCKYMFIYIVILTFFMYMVMFVGCVDRSSIHPDLMKQHLAVNSMITDTICPLMFATTVYVLLTSLCAWCPPLTLESRLH